MTANTINLLFIADIIGDPGIEIVKKNLSRLKSEYSVDFCVANGENASSGKGLTRKTANQLFDIGIDILTSGNHFWDKEAALTQLKSSRNILRPANYPGENSGFGSTVFNLPDNNRIAVINLQGRTFMYPIDCPFKCADTEVERLRKITKLIFVDMHAEATAEKQAIAHHLDGKVSAVIGTHTHVQTADEKILKGGTAFITDAGMTGPVDSVIGLKKEIAIKRFIYQTPFRYTLAGGPNQFNGVLVNINTLSGKAVAIERIYFEENAG